MGLILAFGHKKQMGKDTLAKYVIDVLRPKRARLRIVQRGFADKLYEFLHSVYGWAGYQTKAYYDRNPAEKMKVLPALGKTPRQLLIEFGQHTRKLDDAIWVNATIRGEYDVLLVTDLRFPTEFQALKEQGAHLYRVHNPRIAPTDDEADCALDGWEDKWHGTILNDEGLVKMYVHAESLVDKHITCGGLFT